MNRGRTPQRRAVMASQRNFRGRRPTLSFTRNTTAWIRSLLGANDDAVPMELDAHFDAEALGLKEIGNLASWTVSSCKPGCGVDALRDDDTSLFWQ